MATKFSGNDDSTEDMTEAALRDLADALRTLGADDVTVRPGGAVPTLRAAVADRGEALPVDVHQAVVGHGAGVRKYEHGRLLVVLPGNGGGR